MLQKNSQQLNREDIAKLINSQQSQRCDDQIGFNMPGVGSKHSNYLNYMNAYNNNNNIAYDFTSQREFTSPSQYQQLFQLQSQQRNATNICYAEMAPNYCYGNAGHVNFNLAAAPQISNLQVGNMGDMHQTGVFSSVLPSFPNCIGNPANAQMQMYQQMQQMQELMILQSGQMVNGNIPLSFHPSVIATPLYEAHHTEPLFRRDGYCDPNMIILNNLNNAMMMQNGMNFAAFSGGKASSKVVPKMRKNSVNTNVSKSSKNEDVEADVKHRSLKRKSDVAGMMFDKFSKDNNCNMNTFSLTNIGSHDYDENLTEDNCSFENEEDEDDNTSDFKSSLYNLEKLSKTRFDWKIHFAALLHFYTTFGHCKVPRSLLYECEIALDEHGQVNLENMNDLFSRKISTTDNKLTVEADVDADVSVAAKLVAAATPAVLNEVKVESSQLRNSTDSRTSVASPLSPLLLARDMSHLSRSTSATTSTSESSSVTASVASVPAAVDAVVVKESKITLVSYSSKLGRWLDDQRKARKGKRTKLLPEREALLQMLVDKGDLLWDATELKPNEINKKKGDLNWPRAFAALLKYGSIHGHYNVPKRSNFVCEIEDMPDENGNNVYEGKLGNWLYWQRELKKGRRGGLSADREKQLQNLVDQGLLMWDVSELNPCKKSKKKGDDSWPRTFQALLNYGIEFGNYNVPDKKIYKTILSNGEVYEANLGNWVSWQRKLRKCRRNDDTGVAKLSPDREKLLQELADMGKFNW